MTNGQAYLIFKDLKNEKYTIEEKGWAMHQILSMETHNSITKQDLLDALMWLWHQHFEIKDAFDLLED